MSTDLSGIGLRLRKIRKDNDLTQPVMAAVIDVSDRTYKYYEQEKRELPALAAVKICEAFGVNLEWLLIGRGQAQKGEDPDLEQSAWRAVLMENEARQADLPVESLCKVIDFVAQQTAQSGEAPSDLAKKYFDTLSV
ncbi:helix-turn-helix transcriptional regulator [Leisingera sp. HS039]|uniref:helix-turn-helix domain-containing protein n=1 Tax=Leisingera sp. HS039 TaxID=2818496 RepID=UPI001B3A5A13|nr:helix-turn-helix transcriptional regulator [Leisingera sp. HS039]MBQ4824342.1 helix-turn-helix transcriptional regulator [Leisingera sp. HS039]